MMPRSTRVLLWLAAAWLALASSGCTYPRIGRSFDFFAPARPDNAFYPKVVDWQGRARADRYQTGELADLATELDPAVAGPFGQLKEKFDRFLEDHKRKLAREFTAWSQRQARLHFKPDAQTTLAGDHWPTLSEFFETNGDDCDGLDLIAYGLLRRAGFRPEETYRLVVRRDSDGAHHMVTLWFEDPDDPWVLDATGAMTLEMRKFSDLPPGWTPRVMFNETEQYTVVERAPGRFELARDGDRSGDAPR
jgi:hypothetical protein